MKHRVSFNFILKNLYTKIQFVVKKLSVSSCKVRQLMKYKIKWELKNVNDSLNTAYCIVDWRF